MARLRQTPYYQSRHGAHEAALDAVPLDGRFVEATAGTTVGTRPTPPVLVFVPDACADCGCPPGAGEGPCPRGGEGHCHIRCLVCDGCDCPCHEISDATRFRVTEAGRAALAHGPWVQGAPGYGPPVPCLCPACVLKRQAAELDARLDRPRAS